MSGRQSYRQRLGSEMTLNFASMIRGWSMSTTLRLFAVPSALLIASPALAGPISSYPFASLPYNPCDSVIGTQAGVTKQFCLGNVSGLTNIANNTALSALPHTAYPAVLRMGVVNTGDAPPLAFIPSASPCPLNAGAGDIGSQVPTSDSGCWLAVPSPAALDVRQFGAVIDPGTNATDSAPAINAAFSAWKEAYVPGGLWHVRSEMVCPAGGMLLTDGTNTIFSVATDFVGSDGIFKPGTVLGGISCGTGLGFQMIFAQPTAPNTIADINQYPVAIEANGLAAVGLTGHIIIQNAWDCVSAIRTGGGGTGGLNIQALKCSSYDKGLVQDGAGSEQHISWDQETWGMNLAQDTIFDAEGQGVNGAATFSGQPTNGDTLTVNGASPITFVTAPGGGCTATASETATVLTVTAVGTCSASQVIPQGTVLTGGSFAGTISAPCTLVASAGTCSVTGGAIVGSSTVTLNVGQVVIGAALPNTLLNLASQVNNNPAIYNIAIIPQVCPPATCPTLNTALFVNVVPGQPAPTPLAKSSSVITLSNAASQAYGAQIGQCDTCMIDMTSFQQQVLMNASTVSAPGVTFTVLDLDGASLVNHSVNPVRWSSGYMDGGSIVSQIASSLTIIGSSVRISDNGANTGTNTCYGVNVLNGTVQLSGRFSLSNSSEPSICVAAGSTATLKMSDLHLVIAGSAARTAPAVLATGGEIDWDPSVTFQGHVAGASGNMLEVDSDNANNYVVGNFKGWGVNLTFISGGYMLQGYYDLPDVKYPLTLTPHFVTEGSPPYFTVNVSTPAAYYQLRGDYVDLFVNFNFTSNGSYAGASGNFFVNTNAPGFTIIQGCAVGDLNNFTWTVPPVIRGKATGAATLYFTSLASAGADVPFTATNVPISTTYQANFGCHLADR